MSGLFDGPFWQYAMLFVLAATPWIELLFVVPLGVAMGLGPVCVALDVFAGNTLPVFLIVFGYDRWRASRPGTAATEGPRREGRRRTRALRIWNNYGLPGLAMAGPLLTGIHLATAIALLFNPDRKKLLFWMTLSLLLWTIALAAASYGGLEAVRHWLARA
ncbi:MAG: hypothetical protein AVO39_05750 [delta proteobacterium MLS_D]|jgi:hypothetical protein|nr:MAG: hypothetical protein AVO39_05750 [delta proteobacterium MLS_D]